LCGCDGIRRSFAPSAGSGYGFVGVWRRAVGLLPDAQVNDDEAVVSLGHPDCAAATEYGLAKCEDGAMRYVACVRVC